MTNEQASHRIIRVKYESLDSVVGLRYARLVCKHVVFIIAYTVEKKLEIRRNPAKQCVGWLGRSLYSDLLCTAPYAL